ncbi:unnamed protein product [Lactuca saligna]|uniref:Protein kinase domain-containing protein n=1 Tax=Lactuca saligna TaxID=75948 RepID=A0AA35V3M1_LACSI|nr:unnamed protein product [Lactuca saligna]
MLAVTGKGKESQPSTSSSSIEWLQPCRHFNFFEILIATDKFNESLVIGHGGFGKVYKGNIINGSSVTIVAIKRLDSMSSQGATEFWAEVEMLSKLRHCHLVSLLGYCTARGLDYLHTGTGIEFGVIHHDVKSSNILLHEVVVTLDSIQNLQQKINSSSQTSKTIFRRMLDVFPFNAHDDSKLSSNSKGKIRSDGDNVKDEEKCFTIPIPSLKIFKFSDLERTTSNFSQEWLIDRDGFGEVFTGWVDDKTFAPSTRCVGIFVAVKRYYKGLRESEKLATLNQYEHATCRKCRGAKSALWHDVPLGKARCRPPLPHPYP